MPIIEVSKEKLLRYLLTLKTVNSLDCFKTLVTQ